MILTSREQSVLVGFGETTCQNGKAANGSCHVMHRQVEEGEGRQRRGQPLGTHVVALRVG
jgi:hypothetical protein